MRPARLHWLILCLVVLLQVQKTVCGTASESTSAFSDDDAPVSREEQLRRSMLKLQSIPEKKVLIGSKSSSSKPSSSTASAAAPEPLDEAIKHEPPPLKPASTATKPEKSEKTASSASTTSSSSIPKKSPIEPTPLASEKPASTKASSTTKTAAKPTAKAKVSQTVEIAPSASAKASTAKSATSVVTKPTEKVDTPKATASPTVISKSATTSSPTTTARESASKSATPVLSKSTEPVRATPLATPKVTSSATVAAGAKAPKSPETADPVTTTPIATPKVTSSATLSTAKTSASTSTTPVDTKSTESVRAPPLAKVQTSARSSASASSTAEAPSTAKAKPIDTDKSSAAKSKTPDSTKLGGRPSKSAATTKPSMTKQAASTQLKASETASSAKANVTTSPLSQATQSATSASASPAEDEIDAPNGIDGLVVLVNTTRNTSESGAKGIVTLPNSTLDDIVVDEDGDDDEEDGTVRVPVGVGTIIMDNVHTIVDRLPVPHAITNVGRPFNMDVMFSRTGKMSVIQNGVTIWERNQEPLYSQDFFMEPMRGNVFTRLSDGQMFVKDERGNPQAFGLPIPQMTGTHVSKENGVMTITQMRSSTLLLDMMTGTTVKTDMTMDFANLMAVRRDQYDVSVYVQNGQEWRAAWNVSYAKESINVHSFQSSPTSGGIEMSSSSGTGVPVLVDAGTSALSLPNEAYVMTFQPTTLTFEQKIPTLYIGVNEQLGFVDGKKAAYTECDDDGNCYLYDVQVGAPEQHLAQLSVPYAVDGVRFPVIPVKPLEPFLPQQIEAYLEPREKSDPGWSSTSVGGAVVLVAVLVYLLSVYLRPPPKIERVETVVEREVFVQPPPKEAHDANTQMSTVAVAPTPPVAIITTQHDETTPKQSPKLSPQSSPKKPKKNKSSKSPDAQDRLDLPSEIEPAPSARPFSDNRSPTTPVMTKTLLPDGRTRIGKLTLSPEILGRGNSGTTVYKGEFEGRPVAIKRILLSVQNQEATSHEIKMMISADDHAHVLRYFCQEADNDFIYLALELCSVSVAQLVEDPTEASAQKFHVQLDPALTTPAPKGKVILSAQDIIGSLLRGIYHLHSKNFVHRDIKPHNVLIRHDGWVKVSDFGLARILSPEESRLATKNQAGTIGFIAPETLLQNISSRAVDLFSAGCTIFYLLTNGGHPFGPAFEREMRIRINKADLSALKHDPVASDLVRRLISNDPSQRGTALEALEHPYFWSSDKRLQFLCAVSGRLEDEAKGGPKQRGGPLLEKLELLGNGVFGKDWKKGFAVEILEDLRQRRTYGETSFVDLLRALRNKSMHYADLPPVVQKLYGPKPHGFLNFFTSRFPNLVMTVYYYVCDNLRTDPAFDSYLPPKV